MANPDAKLPIVEPFELPEVGEPVSQVPGLAAELEAELMSDLHAPQPAHGGRSSTPLLIQPPSQVLEKRARPPQAVQRARLSAIWHRGSPSLSPHSKLTCACPRP